MLIWQCLTIFIVLFDGLSDNFSKIRQISTTEMECVRVHPSGRMCEFRSCVPQRAQAPQPRLAQQAQLPRPRTYAFMYLFRWVTQEMRAHAMVSTRDGLSMVPLNITTSAKLHLKPHSQPPQHQHQPQTMKQTQRMRRIQRTKQMRPKSSI